MSTAAMRLRNPYLFEGTNAPGLETATFPGNHGTRAAGRRLGFVAEGRFRGAWPWQGVDHDGVVHGVLREEWAG
jgi:RimJ/RimL family protein N-acetyltransferase